MTSKKWFILFVITLLLIVGIHAGINYFVDPFGIFGDKIFNWYSYDMTNNPRIAKIGYLEKDDNYKNYDSYIIGCSSTSSFSPIDYGEFFSGDWYNMIMYGADMLDVEQTTKYVVNNFDARNIIINIFITNGQKYDEEQDVYTRSMHTKVDGKNPLDFYSRFLFMPLDYSIAKINASKEDTYLTQVFDVFNEENGAYDKKVRDVEPIRELDAYYEKYPVFVDYPHIINEMNKIDETVDSIKRIIEFCEQKDVNLQFVMAPVYWEYLQDFERKDVEEFYTKIAEITPYWDFTSSSLTKEPRFFYDETHFRNAMGRMTSAKMVNSNEAYYPDDIGEYVTKENVKEHINKLYLVENDTSTYTKDVPVITYHNIKENAKESSEITKETFENQIKTLSELGYKGVHSIDLINYVEKGIELPDKSIMITFDDGYLSNYEDAFEILKKYNMKATIFVIGSSVGKTTYKDTEHSIIPHFDFDKAKEMIDSGLIDIQSHTYDFHQWKEYENGDKVRENLLKLEDEIEAEYVDDLRNDCQKQGELFKNNLGIIPVALSYPSGKHETLTDVILKEEGIKISFTIEEGNNTIIKGLPQSLIALNRYNMDERTDINRILGE